MDKKTKKAKVPVFSIILGVAIVLLLCIGSLKKPIDTEIVRSGTAENKKTAEVFLIRDEIVVLSPQSGILNCHVAENSRVPRYTKVASVYEGNYSDDLQVKLHNINEKINQLSNSTHNKSFYVNDAASTENTIYSRIDNIINSVYKNNLSYTPLYKEDLNKLIQNINGKTTAEVDTLSELKQEKAELEKQLSGGVSDIYSPAAGIFNSTIDGYEDYLHVDKIKSITPAYLKEADNNRGTTYSNAVKDAPVVKISDNYKWYVATTLDAVWASTLKVGDAIKLRFPSISDVAYTALVDFISPEDDGNVAIVVSCGEYVENIFSVRKIQCEIIKSSFSGFKISKDAIRILEDGTQGVYVVKDRNAKFKNIEIVYNGESYVIAKEDNSIANNVLLYDEVIISNDELYDGKIVK